MSAHGVPRRSAGGLQPKVCSITSRGTSWLGARSCCTGALREGTDPEPRAEIRFARKGSRGCRPAGWLARRLPLRYPSAGQAADQALRPDCLRERPGGGPACRAAGLATGPAGFESSRPAGWSRSGGPRPLRGSRKRLGEGVPLLMSRPPLPVKFSSGQGARRVGW